MLIAPLRPPKLLLLLLLLVLDQGLYWPFDGSVVPFQRKQSGMLHNCHVLQMACFLLPGRNSLVLASEKESYVHEIEMHWARAQGRR